MIHPILRLLVSQPHMLADHVAAYSGLVSDEVGAIAAAWRRKVVFVGSGALLLLLAVVWSGVALMLWGALPAESMNMPWLVWGTPVLAAAIGAGLVLASRTSPAAAAFASVKSQFAADAAMLRELGAA